MTLGKTGGTSKPPFAAEIDARIEHDTWRWRSFFFGENFGPTAFIVSRKIPQKRMLGWNSILERLTLFLTLFWLVLKKRYPVCFSIFVRSLFVFSRFGFGIFKTHTTKNQSYTHLKLDMWNLENGSGFVSCVRSIFLSFIFFSSSLPSFVFFFIFFFFVFFIFFFFFHFLSSHNFFIYFYFHVFHFLIELKSFLYFSACQFGLEKRASLDFFHGFNMLGTDGPGESSMVMLVHNAVA